VRGKEATGGNGGRLFICTCCLLVLVCWSRGTQMQGMKSTRKGSVAHREPLSYLYTFSVFVTRCLLRKRRHHHYVNTRWAYWSRPNCCGPCRRAELIGSSVKRDNSYETMPKMSSLRLQYVFICVVFLVSFHNTHRPAATQIQRMGHSTFSGCS
jgi:hypothetical protein